MDTKPFSAALQPASSITRKDDKLFVKLFKILLTGYELLKCLLLTTWMATQHRKSQAFKKPKAGRGLPDMLGTRGWAEAVGAAAFGVRKGTAEPGACCSPHCCRWLCHWCCSLTTSCHFPRHSFYLIFAWWQCWEPGLLCTVHQMNIPQQQSLS